MDGDDCVPVGNENPTADQTHCALPCTRRGEITLCDQIAQKPKVAMLRDSLDVGICVAIGRPAQVPDSPKVVTVGPGGVISILDNRIVGKLNRDGHEDVVDLVRGLALQKPPAVADKNRPTITVTEGHAEIEVMRVQLPGAATFI